jgi:hypothetical protein
MPSLIESKILSNRLNLCIIWSFNFRRQAKFISLSKQFAFAIIINRIQNYFDLAQMNDVLLQIAKNIALFLNDFFASGPADTMFSII